MTIDTKRFKNKIDQKTPNINLVPLLDVIFTIMIFLLVMISQQPSLDQNHTPEQISAKPTSQSGTSEYYLMPLNGLHKVTVNGVDKSEYIRNGAIAVHTRVMDEGQIVMDSKTGSITITSPAELDDVAVRAPSAS
ncbi:MAG: biopolymer transporter ExbD [Methanosphaera sp.]|uniref:biopolymer transporter ExbD n=1 Tax=Methanosphaera sp. BMS TaxID=1789762 RepID=UPI000DC1D7D5|nr:biopolymer transporter ExbD [Methanosphaera sp. BMS]AWX33137.1 hypothetical protein AW729_08520 [Methanosphaera sp. BMS]MBO7719584.1 biopolymer transporter ExbD [Methanosphaera sp.]MBQ6443408.1 biopolymer transporter ExbD [Methanosphaera sp.]